MISIRYSDKLWTVGILEPETERVSSRWTALRDCKDANEAMAWVSYLNGGDHPTKRGLG